MNANTKKTENEHFPKYIGSYKCGAEFLEYMSKAYEYATAPSHVRIVSSSPFAYLKSKDEYLESGAGAMSQFFEHIRIIWEEALLRGEPSMWWFAGEVLTWGDDLFCCWYQWDIQDSIMGDVWKNVYFNILPQTTGKINDNEMEASLTKINDVWSDNDYLNVQEAACACYEIAAELGSIHAMLWLAWCYKNGTFGRKQNPQRSGRWLSRVQQVGIPEDLKFHEFDFMTDILDTLLDDAYNADIVEDAVWDGNPLLELDPNPGWRELDVNLANLTYFLCSLGLDKFAERWGGLNVGWDSGDEESFNQLKNVRREWYAWIDSKR